MESINDTTLANNNTRIDRSFRYLGLRQPKGLRFVLFWCSVVLCTECDCHVAKVDCDWRSRWTVGDFKVDRNSNSGASTKALLLRA